MSSESLPYSDQQPPDVLVEQLRAQGMQAFTDTLRTGFRSFQFHEPLLRLAAIACGETKDELTHMPTINYTRGTSLGVFTSVGIPDSREDAKIAHSIEIILAILNDSLSYGSPEENARSKRRTVVSRGLGELADRVPQYSKPMETISMQLARTAEGAKLARSGFGIMHHITWGHHSAYAAQGRGVADRLRRDIAFIEVVEGLNLDPELINHFNQTPEVRH